MRIAAFYFDGIPSKIFRLRFYLLYTVTEKRNEVEMELYTLDHAIEKAIREKSTSPQVWNDILQTFSSQQQQQQQQQQTPSTTKPPPASKKAIRQLPTVTVTPEDLVDENNRECCICLDE
mmetsp:Transcript_32309/g.43073  ORF Transcript_32309/g.43073 Transcript_32309/m.43073 type:complete len:120 (-) Transcript_32309:2014-2373(-)